MEIYLSTQDCIPHFIINSRDGLILTLSMLTRQLCQQVHGRNPEGSNDEISPLWGWISQYLPRGERMQCKNTIEVYNIHCTVYTVHIWSFSELIAVVHRLRVKIAFVSLKNNLLCFIFLFHESCIWIYGGEKTPSNTFLWQYVKFWDWNVKICVSTKKAMETKCFPLPWDFFWQTVSSAKFRWKKPQVGAHCKL